MLKSTLLLASVFTSSFALAASPKTYQATGQVVAADEATITIKKGNENLVITRDPKTTTVGGQQPQVGDKATVTYTMLATAVTTQPAKGAAKDTNKTKSTGPAEIVAPAESVQ